MYIDTVVAGNPLCQAWGRLSQRGREERLHPVQEVGPGRCTFDRARLETGVRTATMPELPELLHSKAIVDKVSVALW